MKIKYLIMAICLYSSPFLIHSMDDRQMQTSSEYLNVNERFLDAVKANKIELVNELILSGTIDVNYQDKRGNTALIWASHHGHAEAVRLLLDASADVNASNDNDNTALTSASKLGHTEIVRLLLQAEANVNARNHQRSTALMYASQNGHTEIVKLLLQAEADVNAKSNNDVTALMIASIESDTKIVRLLLEAEADVNIISDNGNTALTAASASGNAKIVKMLLDAGADITLRSNRGSTALDTAYLKNKTKCIDLLLDRGAEVNQYFAQRKATQERRKGVRRAIETKNFRALKALIENGAYANENAQKFIRASYKQLFNAIKTNDIAKIQELVDQDLSLHIKDTAGNTPLYSAIKFKKYELINYFILLGLPLNATNDNGHTALHVAIKTLGEVDNLIHQNHNLLESAIAKDMLADIQRYEANKAECLVDRAKLIELIKNIIALDPSIIDDKDNAGNTPLHLAASQSDSELIDCLLSHGANPAIYNNRGELPMQIAVGYSTDCVDVFMKYAYRITLPTV